MHLIFHRPQQYTLKKEAANHVAHGYMITVIGAHYDIWKRWFYLNTKHKVMCVCRLPLFGDLNMQINMSTLP